MLDFEDTPRQGIKSRHEEQTKASESQAQEQANTTQTTETQNNEPTGQNREASTGLPSTDLPEAKPTEPMACSIDSDDCEACQ